MKIAIIGTGISGNAAAWALSGHHDITVYEKNMRPGGHSNTLDVDFDGRTIAVDTGFIVYNELNYPGLTALFEALGVETLASDMSFAVSADNGAFEWKGGGNNWLATLRGLFAQPSNIISPSYLGMLRDILRFNAISVADMQAGRLQGVSLGDYFKSNAFSPRLLHDYLVPMGAAIWSTPALQMLDFPAENFVAFFSNHRLLQYDRPVWRTVKGGSREYVARLTAPFKDRIRLGCAVTHVTRHKHGVRLMDSSGGIDDYDQVVFAAHSDETLAMLTDADAQERDVLENINYSPNVAYLHRDLRLMPKRRAAWSSWNFLRWQRAECPVNDVAITYWMNELQGLPAECPLFVSLNPPFAPDESKTFARLIYEHPLFDAAAFAAQKRLPGIQGRRNTWFCGAWTGYGFHEDGLQSGLNVARAIEHIAQHPETRPRDTHVDAHDIAPYLSSEAAE